MRVLALVATSLFYCAVAFSQVLDIRDARSKTDAAAPIRTASTLPIPVLMAAEPGQVTLLPGLFRERRELNTKYLLKLRPDNLLQNHYLEAGIRIDKPLEEMHQGWEAPSCQLRGHFLGHWMSAAAATAANDHNPELASRLSYVVTELARCQTLNGGTWVGSIPEKYFDILNDPKRSIWSPQYTVHKTLLGLQDAYRLSGNTEALRVWGQAAEWFQNWTAAEVQSGHGQAIYNGESCGMLEVWANLYGTTHQERHLELANRYASPGAFAKILENTDPLSNNHANASIPWFQGAARLYEVTGDPRYRRIVERFWESAVTQRGMFATTGNNAGEFWVPPRRFNRFLGSRTQEHCTVYNMIRVAQFLLKWTGDVRYANYIETALYNGVLAQQHPQTGMPCYFLPLGPGSKKVWGSETHDFWCCHGSVVQAQTLYEELTYYAAADGLVVNQFIPSTGRFTVAGQKVTISQRFDDNAMVADLLSNDGTSHWVIDFEVTTANPARWNLRVRRPAWVVGKPRVFVDGAEVPATLTASGYLQLDRTWKSSRVRLVLAKRVTATPLPGDPTKVALMDGPIVLAGLTDKETVLQIPSVSSPVAATPLYEHQYTPTGDWQWSHYLVRGRSESILFKPIYEVTDERYTVYFGISRKR